MLHKNVTEILFDTKKCFCRYPSCDRDYFPFEELVENLCLALSRDQYIHHYHSNFNVYSMILVDLVLCFFIVYRSVSEDCYVSPHIPIAEASSTFMNSEKPS